MGRNSNSRNIIFPELFTWVSLSYSWAPFSQNPKELPKFTVSIPLWNKSFLFLIIFYLFSFQHKLLITCVSLFPIRLWICQAWDLMGTLQMQISEWMNQFWMNVCVIFQPRILISLWRERKWQGLSISNHLHSNREAVSNNIFIEN